LWPCPGLEFYFFEIFRLHDLFTGGACLFEDPAEVGGRSAISLQMLDSVDQ